MMNFRSIKFKTTSFSILSAVLVFVLFLVMNIFHASNTAELIEDGMNSRTKELISTMTGDIHAQLDTINEMLVQEVNSGLKVVATLIKEQNGLWITQEEKAQWTAINQFTKEAVEIELPKMMLGGDWLGQYTDFQSQVPVIDRSAEMIGGTTTVFQRMNEAGDMLRVATNVKKMDGTRAIGTYIPVKNQDGTDNQVVKTVLSGKIYRGRAFVVNAWYLTIYKPVFNDDNDKVIGMLYFGIQQEKSDAIRKNIMKRVIGKTGYVYVLNGKGKDKGTYIISHKGKRDGENILNAVDANGKKFIADIINSTMNLKSGEVGFSNYYWKNKGEDEAREKIVGFTYFEPWDWVIGAGAYVDDFKDTQNEIAATLKSASIVGFLVSSGVIIVLVIFIAFLMGKTTKPILETVKLMEKVSEGDLTGKAEVTSKDELGSMAVAVNRTLEQLNTLVATIQERADVIHDSAGNLSAVSSNLVEYANETVQEAQSVSNASDVMSMNINNIASAVEEMSVNANSVSSTTEQVSVNMKEVAAAMEQINQGVGKLTEKAKEGSRKAEISMQQSSGAVEVMDQLTDAARDIGQVTEVIKKIAEQTNLLALNATIEAASAGDAGKGFAVVANEIKELANQSSGAAENISKNIEGVQLSALEVSRSVQMVNEGILENKTSTDETAEELGGLAENMMSSARVVAEASTGATDIARNIAEIADGAVAMASNAGEAQKMTAQVLSNIKQVNEVAGQSSEGASDVNHASSTLSEIAEELQKVVSQFKVRKTDESA